MRFTLHLDGMISRRSPATKISAIVSDVDGTVVTDDKRLTERSRAAVSAVRQSGLPLCLISSRPPRGFAQLRSVLEIVTPCAGFNGGVIVAPDGSVIEQHLLPSQRARDTVGFLTEHGIDIWLFSGPIGCSPIPPVPTSTMRSAPWASIPWWSGISLLRSTAQRRSWE